MRLNDDPPLKKFEVTVRIVVEETSADEATDVVRSQLDFLIRTGETSFIAFETDSSEEMEELE